MTYQVSVEDTAISLGETDRVKSILQNVAIILRTRRGTCPLHRDFGISQDYLHKPTTVAKAMMYAEIRDAVEAFEPRCNVVSVSFADTGSAADALIPIVEVEIVNEQEY